MRKTPKISDEDGAWSQPVIRRTAIETADIWRITKWSYRPVFHIQIAEIPLRAGNFCFFAIFEIVIIKTFLCLACEIEPIIIRNKRPIRIIGSKRCITGGDVHIDDGVVIIIGVIANKQRVDGDGKCRRSTIRLTVEFHPRCKRQRAIIRQSHPGGIRPKKRVKRLGRSTALELHLAVTDTDAGGAVLGNAEVIAVGGGVEGGCDGSVVDGNRGADEWHGCFSPVEVRKQRRQVYRYTRTHRLERHPIAG